ncbi:MAG: type IV toxin-antitoxin system AbiEi family antitoxin domain-containing protein [Acidimicrobiales bacterium]
MQRLESRELRSRFRDHHGVVSRSELRVLGVTSKTERAMVAKGEWERVGRNVVTPAGLATPAEARPSAR